MPPYVDNLSARQISKGAVCRTGAKDWLMLRTDLQHQMFPPAGSPPVRWRIADGLVPYDEAVAVMEAEVAAIAEGQAQELVWLVEHPPLYTAGTSANAADLIEPDRFPVFAT